MECHTVMSAQERYDLIRSVGEECIQESELRQLVEKKADIRCYDGFEPSGRMHIAQGIYKAINVNKCTQANCTFVFWIADWFALMNDKVGGELERITVVGKYLIEVWKASGMVMDKVEFLWNSQEIAKNAERFWSVALDIARRNTIARIKKCCAIMGKTEGSLTCAQILYPLMQCSDIFFLRADICQLGLDQRKVNMLAREYCDMIGRKLKPVILSHHMLSGLKQGQGKMSKSDPDSAIFMEDTPEDVARKINQAYCPPVKQKQQQVGETATDDGVLLASDDKNPVLDYIQCLVFSTPNGTLTIESEATQHTPQQANDASEGGGEESQPHTRAKRTSASDTGSAVTYTSYDAVETAFIEGVISEPQLKAALITHINKTLAPVQRHFQTDAEAKRLLQLVHRYRNISNTSTTTNNDTDDTDSTKANVGSRCNVSRVAHVDRAESETTHACMFMPVMLTLPLPLAVQMIASVQCFLAQHPNAKVSLILPEWMAIAANEITGEAKDIAAALEYNARLLHEYGLPAVVTVVHEKELILSRSFDFWITAIHAGRSYPLSFVEGLHRGREVRNAGQVVSALMRVANAKLLRCTHVLSTPVDGELNTLISDFTRDAVVCVNSHGGVGLHLPTSKQEGHDETNAVATTATTDTSSHRTRSDSATLQKVDHTAECAPARECTGPSNAEEVNMTTERVGWLHRGVKPDADMLSVAATGATDEMIFVDDTEMDVRRKIKRAYCAPQETNNGIMDLALYFLQRHGSFDVDGAAPEEGSAAAAGEGATSEATRDVPLVKRHYTSAEVMCEDCRRGVLHPADVKAAVVQQLLELSAPARTAMASPEMKKLSQTVRTAQKKLLKRRL